VLPSRYSAAAKPTLLLGKNKQQQHHHQTTTPALSPGLLFVPSLCFTAVSMFLWHVTEINQT
jgi:hypothetical protein